MGDRSRSRSCSRDGRRGHRERGGVQRDVGGDTRDSARTTLLVRNLARSAIADDLRYKAEKYGQLRDIYIPRDYYTKEPRGIAFIEYLDARDCEDAKYGLDRQVINGREVRKPAFTVRHTFKTAFAVRHTLKMAFAERHTFKPAFAVRHTF